MYGSEAMAGTVLTPGGSVLKPQGQSSKLSVHLEASSLMQRPPNIQPCPGVPLTQITWNLLALVCSLALREVCACAAMTFHAS